jgi:hypothetical protein
MDLAFCQERLSAAGVIFERGLSSDEISGIENAHRFHFPPDLRGFHIPPASQPAWVAWALVAPGTKVRRSVQAGITPKLAYHSQLTTMNRPAPKIAFTLRERGIRVETMRGPATVSPRTFGYHAEWNDNLIESFFPLYVKDLAESLTIKATYPTLTLAQRIFNSARLKRDPGALEALPMLREALTLAKNREDVEDWVVERINEMLNC